MSLETIKSYALPVASLGAMATATVLSATSTNPTVSLALGILGSAVGLCGCWDSMKKLDSEKSVKNLSINLLYACTAALGIYKLRLNNSQFHATLEANQLLQRDLAYKDEKISSGFHKIVENALVIENANKTINAQADFIKDQVNVMRKIAMMYEAQIMRARLDPKAAPSDEEINNNMDLFCSGEFDNNQFDERRKDVCKIVKELLNQTPKGENKAVNPPYLPSFF